MAYNEALAARVRAVLEGREAIDERRMFGGLTFMVRGHMACGIVRGDLMVRVGRAAYEAALAEPHVRPMDFTGRPIEGMVYVAEAGLISEADLARWVGRGAENAESLGNT